jgi:hypothetical protein
MIECIHALYKRTVNALWSRSNEPDFCNQNQSCCGASSISLIEFVASSVKLEIPIHCLFQTLSCVTCLSDCFESEVKVQTKYF